MRVTRLHLLFAGLGLIALLFGVLNWLDEAELLIGRQGVLEPQTPIKPKTPMSQAAKPAPVAATTRPPVDDVARRVAIVGETYQSLRRQYGEIPTIGQPLRAAKQHLAAAKPDQANQSARAAWQAIKNFNVKMDKAANTYQVARGDTLWKIAAAYSPVRAGAGWVAIWKANKDLVDDFDRIEIGWTLAIPPQPSQYVMPFWKPQGL